MPEIVDKISKTKKINKNGAGRPVRLWVRAKFLGFRRYFKNYVDPKFNRIQIKIFLDLKESTIDKEHNIILEKE